MLTTYPARRQRFERDDFCAKPFPAHAQTGEESPAQRTHHVRVWPGANAAGARVLAAPQVLEEKKTELKTLHARLNPFQ
jgi:hypothetical protein